MLAVDKSFIKRIWYDDIELKKDLEPDKPQGGCRSTPVGLEGAIYASDELEGRLTRKCCLIIYVHPLWFSHRRSTVVLKSTKTKMVYCLCLRWGLFVCDLKNNRTFQDLIVCTLLQADLVVLEKKQRHEVYNNYRVAKKFGTLFVCLITSSNIGQFSNFFSFSESGKICNIR